MRFLEALDIAGDYYNLYRYDDLHDPEENVFLYNLHYLKKTNELMDTFEQVDGDYERMEADVRGYMTPKNKEDVAGLGRGANTITFVIKKDVGGDWVLGSFYKKLSSFESLDLDEEGRKRVKENRVDVHILPSLEEEEKEDADLF